MGDKKGLNFTPTEGEIHRLLRSERASTESVSQLIRRGILRMFLSGSGQGIRVWRRTRAIPGNSVTLPIHFHFRHE